MSSKKAQLKDIMAYLWENYPDQISQNLSEDDIQFWYNFIIQEDNIQGSGLMDMFKKTLRIAKSIPYRTKALLTLQPRNNIPTGRFKRWLDANAHKKIVSIEVGRTPLSKGVNTALNIL